MKNFKSQWWICLLFSLGLAACGSQKTSSGLGSTRGDGTIYTPGTQNLLGECTRVVSSGVTLSGQISTYYYAGQALTDRVMLNLQTVPSELTTTDTYALQFYSWKEPSNGDKQVNATPISFYYLDKLTGSVLGNQMFTSITKAQIDNLIAANSNLSVFGVTTANFLQHYYLILTSLDWQWEAVLMNVYNNSTSVGSANSLLPPYYADPNVYANRVPVTSLQGLHPLNAYRSSGYSEQNYKSMTDTICTELFGTVRKLASVNEHPPVDPHVQTTTWSFLGWLQSIWTKFLNLF